MAVDLSQIQNLQAQIEAETNALSTTPPGPAHDVIQAQLAGLNAQLKTAIGNAQAQNQAWGNILSGLSIFSMLNSGGGGGLGIPTIIGMFK